MKLHIARLILTIMAVLPLHALAQGSNDGLGGKLQ